MSDLPYRQSVYGFILNDKNQILLVFKKNSKMWDFPGGGIDTGESLEQAIRREVLEELGINNISILHISNLTYKYDWPEKEMEKNFNKTGVWRRGQEQHFVIIKLEGADNEIRLQEEELLESRWVSFSDIKSYLGYPDQYKILISILSELK
jgi:mutator protein MutT